MSNTKLKSVDCPTCHKQVEWTEKSEFRPFCSKRCKLIDFGDWASEKISIPGEANYPVTDEDRDQ
ncbi:MAG: DNA gyrase inhibitor YacG [Pseudohongiella sp.]|nr:DNA gyrase inhibitor YacG [Pseudohongiella sp.]